jgi:hypothetical protein
MFTPNAGVHDSMVCPVCGRDMLVDRDQSGPRGRWETMAWREGKRKDKVYDKYDFFYCRYHDEGWHNNIMKLKDLAAETPSPTLRSIYLTDADTMAENYFKAEKIMLQDERIIDEYSKG